DAEDRMRADRVPGLLEELGAPVGGETLAAAGEDSERAGDSLPRYELRREHRHGDEPRDEEHEVPAPLTVTKRQTEENEQAEDEAEDGSARPGGDEGNAQRRDDREREEPQRGGQLGQEDEGGDDQSLRHRP